MADRIRAFGCVVGAVIVLVVACGGEVPDADTTGTAPEVEEQVVAGELGVILEGDRVVASGVVMYVVRGEGERTAALFRGPRKLADVTTGGTYELSGDSLPARVRELRPGETMAPGESG